MPNKIFFGNGRSRGGVLIDADDVGKGVAGGISILGKLAIGIAILSVLLGVMIVLGLGFYSLVRPIYDFILIKILVFPSTFDLFFNILGENHLAQILIFIGLIIIYITSGMFIKKKWIRGYLFANSGILVLRILFSISMGVMGLFLEEGETFSNGQLVQTEFKLVNIQNEQEHSFDYYTYSESEKSEGDKAQDAKSVLWVAFGEDEDEIGEFSTFSTEFQFEGFLFSSPQDINRFQTTVSYGPINGEYNGSKNQTTFNINVIADGEVIENYSLSPTNNEVHIDLPLQVEKTFSIEFEGEIQDRSTVSLLNPKFIREF